MNVVSLFSGVGGFDLGFEQAGFTTVYQCEWDKHATNILNRHWPDVPKWGDVQTLTGAEILRHCQTPDVIIWGSPCQDLSVAGKRAGLSGERSGLFHQGIRIINELREATDGRYPRVSVWENVAGALNSNRGADFGTVLDEMAEAGALVIEWALLDAQHFGVPQRRRRVFVVAIFDPATASRCPDPLLPVSESVSRDSAKGGKKGQTVAGTVAAGVDGGDPVGGGQAVAFNKVIRSGARDSNGDLPPEVWREQQVAPTLNAFDTGDTRTTTAIVDFTHDSEVRVYDSVAPTLQARMGTGGNQTPCVTNSTVSVTLRIGRDSSDFVAQTAAGFKPGASANAHTIGYEEERSPALEGGGGGNNKPAVLVAPSLTASNDPSRSPQSAEITQQVTAVHEATMAVRRLTPLECERLMGWPDNWTDGQADSHRYRQCGNGVATPVAKWIASHLRPIL